jgi:hypothetical protein
MSLVLIVMGFLVKTLVLPNDVRQKADKKKTLKGVNKVSKRYGDV